jgi:peroxiredoxin Q/BCP
MELTIGQKAPVTDFVDSTGKAFSLLGKKTVLYFYPKDDTPGCTAQACNLNENLDYLESKGFLIYFYQSNRCYFFDADHRYLLK